MWLKYSSRKESKISFYLMFDQQFHQMFFIHSISLRLNSELKLSLSTVFYAPLISSALKKKSSFCLFQSFDKSASFVITRGLKLTFSWEKQEMLKSKVVILTTNPFFPKDVDPTTKTDLFFIIVFFGGCASLTDMRSKILRNNIHFLKTLKVAYKVLYNR